jgi:competence ComEA-like helix-hairpin-helix protein
LESETRPKWKYPKKDSFPKKKKEPLAYQSNVRKSPKKDTLRQKVFSPKKEYVKAFKYPEGTLVEVNSADTTELKKIPGIGSGIAGGIVRYRERLGGFYALSQLEEVKHVTPELLKWFKLDNDSIRKLEINKASLDKLRAHPYLTFYQAKVIVEHRRKKGQIKSLSQLALYEEFTEKDLERLSAYVSFD